METVRPWVRLARRQVRRGAARAAAPLLSLRNRISSVPVLGSAPVNVSLTSYGTRLNSVHLTIESIARGQVKPQRLILWVEDPAFAAAPTAALVRLQRRGLEIEVTEGFGPHTKYYPYAVSMEQHTTALVTADDDILYPRSWLAALCSSYAKYPDAVSCHWANRIQTKDGLVAPYENWLPSRTPEPRRDQLALGVSGVLYPPGFIQKLAEAGAGFRELSPTADDIWLHWQALRNHFAVRQVTGTPRHFPVVPGSQAVSLQSSNVMQGRNNEWIRRLYREEDVRAMEGAVS
ncbi:hypothetical protein ACWGQ2_00700 [Arthrobacter sp. NPDC055585]